MSVLLTCSLIYRYGIFLNQWEVSGPNFPKCFADCAETVRQFLQRISFVIVGVRKSLCFLNLSLLKTILQMLILSYFKTWLILKAFWQFVFFCFFSKNKCFCIFKCGVFLFFLGTLNFLGISGSQNECFAGADLRD